MGALLFGTAGVLSASMESSCPPSSSFCFESGPEMSAVGVLLAVAGGAGLGALIGSMIRSDRWEAWEPASPAVRPIVRSDGRSVQGGLRIALP